MMVAEEIQGDVKTLWRQGHTVQPMRLVKPVRQPR